MEEIKMKKKASAVVKQMIAAVSSIAKTKTLALKNKTSAIKTRIIIFSLLWDNKSVMSSISHKLHALLGQQHLHAYNQRQCVESHDDDRIHAREEDDDDDQDQTKGKSAIVVYACTTTKSTSTSSVMTDPEDNYNILEPHYKDGYLAEAAWGSDDHHDGIGQDAQKYQDMTTHSLLDSDGEFGSVIDIVKNSKQEAGQDFSLEDEIDHVADLFIRRFHHQIRIQKQHSFKRHQKEEMLIHSGTAASPSY